MTQQNFLSNESGAVTVDWVVLTAALVGLGLAVMTVVSNGVEDLTGDVDTTLRDGSIIRTAFVGNVSDARDSACTSFGACDDTLTSGALKALTTDELNNVNAVTYGDDYATALTGSGLSQDGDGNWGTTAVDGTFTANDAATTAYNTAAAAQSSQNALIDAEKAARAN